MPYIRKNLYKSLNNAKNSALYGASDVLPHLVLGNVRYRCGMYNNDFGQNHAPKHHLILHIINKQSGFKFKTYFAQYALTWKISGIGPYGKLKFITLTSSLSLRLSQGEYATGGSDLGIPGLGARSISDNG